MSYGVRVRWQGTGLQILENPVRFWGTPPKHKGLLAQLNRALGYEPNGWGFESLGDRHFLIG